jgi:hypothetical protein
MSNFGGMRTWTGEQNLLSSCTRLVCLSRWRMYLYWSMLKSLFQKLFFLVRRFRPRLTDSQERRGAGVCIRVCFFLDLYLCLCVLCWLSFSGGHWLFGWCFGWCVWKLGLGCWPCCCVQCCCLSPLCLVRPWSWTCRGRWKHGHGWLAKEMLYFLARSGWDFMRKAKTAPRDIVRFLCLASRFRSGVANIRGLPWRASSATPGSPVAFGSSSSSFFVITFWGR